MVLRCSLSLSLCLPSPPSFLCYPAAIQAVLPCNVKSLRSVDAVCERRWLRVHVIAVGSIKKPITLASNITRCCASEKPWESCSTRTDHSFTRCKRFGNGWIHSKHSYNIFFCFVFFSLLFFFFLYFWILLRRIDFMKRKISYVLRCIFYYFYSGFWSEHGHSSRPRAPSLPYYDV